jgi:methylmalonyl-CoA mutase
MPSAASSAFSPAPNHWIAGLEPDQHDANLASGIRMALGDQTGEREEARTTSWDFGAYVATGENDEVNAYAREEVEAGAEALLFRLYQQPDTEDIRQLLDGIDLKAISLHCTLRYPGQDPAELFRDLIRYLRQEGLDLSSISGSVDFDPLLDWSEPPFPPLIRLLFFVSRWMPEFSVLQVNAAGFNNGIAEADTELALALAKGAEYLVQIKARNYPVALANKHLKFAFTVGTSFYGDVAKLRAFRALWSKVLEELGLENPPLAQIAAHTDITTMTGDAEKNNLSLHLQALAADLGGADIIFPAPAEGPRSEATSEGRAQTRAIPQAFDPGDSLTDVAHIDHVFLDDLTIALVQSAWARYKGIQEQGGFAEADDF